VFRERVIEFVTDLPKSPKDMAERLKRVPLWYKSASLITVASLAACQLGKKLGFVTPPPEGTKTPPPTETIPPIDQASETKIFAGMLIGEAGIGMISGLTQEENPDPVFVSEIESRALEALRVEDANLDPERIKVYAFEMQGETGNAPFPLISVSDKDNPDKLLSVFAGFGVDANGVLVPPKGGKIAVLLRLTTVQSESESSLVYVGIQSREDPLAIYLPALFEVKQSADEIYFIPPYADSLGQSVPVRGGKYLFSPKPVESTPTPEAAVETLKPDFSLDLVGVVNEEGVSLTVPFTIGLMKDIRERPDEPIKEIMLNPERPDAPDKLAYYYLRICWLNHKKNYPEHADISWAEYLSEVQAGRGLIKLALADPSIGSWNKSGKLNLKIEELNPIDGFTYLSADKMFNLPGLYASYVTSIDGRLLIVDNHNSPVRIAYERKDMDEGIAKGIFFTRSFSDSIAYVLVDTDIEKVLQMWGYMGFGQTDPNFGQLAMPEKRALTDDIVPDRADLSKSKPYFLIKQ